MEKNLCFAILLLVFGFAEVYSLGQETVTTNDSDSGNVLLTGNSNLDPLTATIVWGKTLARTKREKVLTYAERKALDEKRERNLRIATIRARMEREEYDERARELEEARRTMNRNEQLDREMQARWNRQH